MELRVNTLPQAVDAQILPVAEAALRELAAGNMDAASRLAIKVWSLVPEPKYGWDSSLSYMRAMVKVLRQSGSYGEAIEILNGHLTSDYYRDYEYHPHFLLGTVYYAIGQLESAKLHFKEAHKIGGMRCFQGEPPEYKQLIRGKSSERKGGP